jgi:peptide/nickel transport system permease protein
MTSTSKNPNDIVQLEDGLPEPESVTRIIIRRFFKHRMAVFGMFLMTLMLLYVGVGSIIYSEDYANDTDIRARFEPPSAEHLFGTDEAGRDVMARTIYGGQISLAIGIISVSISVTMGTLIGLVSGYFGGIIDAVLMRIVDALLAVPILVLLLMLNRVFIEYNTSLVTVLGREVSITVIAIVGIIGFTGWMGLSRIVRSQVLTLKQQEFIVAAEMMGARTPRIIFIHILPNCIAPIVVSATLGIGGAIILEAALSFLGFGVLPPTATWGNIINRARGNIEEWWWLWMAPGLLITITVLSINFIGDGLRDAFDPYSVK